MARIGEEDAREIRRVFDGMAEPVTLLLFTRDDRKACPYCEDTREILQEVADLSDQVTLEIHDLDEEAELAEKYGVDKAPALVYLRADGSDTGIRFFGIPAGYEFGTVVEDIVDVSKGGGELSSEAVAFLAGLDQDVHIQVFVTPT